MQCDCIILINPFFMIDKKKYIEICNDCDWLLNEVDSSVQRVSISWLHVIREHPIILSRYESLFTNLNAIQNIKRWVTTVINYLRILSNWALSITNNSNNVALGEFENNTTIDYLFVSHLIESSHLNKESDFYFGRIISSLESENFKTVTLLFNHTKISNNELRKRYKLSYRRVFLSNFLSIRNEISLFFQLRRESKGLKTKLEKFKSNSLQAKIIKESSRQCMSNSSFDNLRRFYQFKELIAKYNPKNIITTFEGHAWERMLFRAAKDHSASIQCMGYQHTSLFRLQHSVLRSLNIFYNPDVILTTGLASKKRFENSDIGVDKPIVILGSSRGKDLVLSGETKSSSKNSCLVIPEGFDSECITLFRFSIHCSKLAPEVNFIFKLHPIMSRETFVRKYPEFRKLPGNVMWASDNLQSDFSECRWALYRGTTMIVQACYAGLIPLYFQSCSDEMSIDLLDEVSAYKTTLTNPADFFKSISVENYGNYNRDLVIDYCANLYSPFNHNVLKGLPKLSEKL